MSLKVVPGDQLEFVRPLTRVVTSTLRLQNSGTSNVAFKVKTTAPRQYCVRPNSGLIKPQSTMEVQVMFQPLSEEPPAGFKCKDKFLVQSVQVADNLEEISPDLWANIEATNKQSIEQKKLKCAFVDEEAPVPQQVNGIRGFNC
ncbi:PapD-like protein, partial [Phycomyces nitens]